MVFTSHTLHVSPGVVMESPVWSIPGSLALSAWFFIASDQPHQAQLTDPDRSKDATPSWMTSVDYRTHAAPTEWIIKELLQVSLSLQVAFTHCLNQWPLL